MSVEAGPSSDDYKDRPGKHSRPQAFGVSTQSQHLIAADTGKNNSQSIVSAAQNFGSTAVDAG
jgi:hypothetical protein